MAYNKRIKYNKIIVLKILVHFFFLPKAIGKIDEKVQDLVEIRKGKLLIEIYWTLHINLDVRSTPVRRW